MADQENTPLDRQGGEDTPGKDAEGVNSPKGKEISENLEDKFSELGRYQQAREASEPAFTLHPEKGIPPGPEKYNTEDEQDEHNLKQ